MRMMLLNWMVLGLVGVAVLVSPGIAHASHYRLASIEAFDSDSLERLHAIGVVTTEDFLVQAVDREARQALSQQTGIVEMEILVFARLCELLQIEGVGPRAAQLLRAAGVVSVADLAARNPAALAERVMAVNAVEQLTGVNPTEENLVDWISSAGDVPLHVQ